jgi:hypothetical protein
MLRHPFRQIVDMGLLHEPVDTDHTDGNWHNAHHI